MIDQFVECVKHLDRANRTTHDVYNFEKNKYETTGLLTYFFGKDKDSKFMQALETLKNLAAGCAADGLYDLVFIDANKRHYRAYYDLVFPMVRKGGLILADNTLWDGKILQDPLPSDAQTQEIARFNDMVAADDRVSAFILPLRDGLTFIRKK